MWENNCFRNDQNVTQAVNFWPYFSKIFNPRVNTTLYNKKNPNILVTFEVYNVHFIFLVGSPSGHPLKILKHIFLHFVQECVQGVSCQFGEFSLCRCEDIASLRYQKLVCWVLKKV